MIALIVFVVFVGVGWLIGKGCYSALSLLFKNSSEINPKEPSITINNYTTEQHLHISEKQIRELSNKK